MSPLRPRTVILAGIALLGLGLLIERWSVSDAEALEAAWADLLEAVAQERQTDVAARLGPGLVWEGPELIGGGDRDAALARLGEFWAQAEDTRLLAPATVAITGAVGTVDAPGRVLFKFGGFQTAWKVTLRATFLRQEGGWLLNSLTVVSLDRGFL